MIVIDGTTYDIPIVEMIAQADMLDKYAKRTVDGVLHRELIGVFDNYSIKFASSVSTSDMAVYSALWFKLTEPTPWHTVVLPTILGTREIEGYFAETKHDAFKQKDGSTYWKNLSTSFISKSKRP